ncbi:putative bifunctional diguanylate cyclase/phosphodiesterase [Cupriavidus basilensis]|uniref:putative bifunctional diguanylate cyclase/phosphodiesterase n=1 Tax=Cupriavidus basilensis TaxID=68895 RepID=UPI00075195A6|nr:EAL domain-containing protein [Cupriavidus basilensis]
MMQLQLLARLRRLWSVERDNPALLKAQYRAFSRKIPLMYFVLLVNSWALAFTHLDAAPRWLAVYCPIALSALCVARFAYWHRMRHTEPTADMAWRALVLTNRFSVPVAVSFTVWAVLLFPYGDDYARAHVAFYMGITVISCIFSLMYLRSAALTTALIVNGTFIVFFLATGIPTFVATAANIVLVTGAMLAIVMSHYRDFTRLIDAQVRAEALGNENLLLANLDSLTQLPNRRKFFALLNAACDKARAGGNRFAVAIIDLDGFKPVNDLYGHALGDRLLTEVGQRLRCLCDEHSHVARLGGDEFALILGDAPDDAQLQAFGQRVCAVLHAPFLLANTTIHIAASAGLATFPDMAADATTLYEYADYALYHGKRSNRGAVSLFSASHRDQLHRDANIEQALRKADLQQELSVHFQPIVDVRSDATIAFEALARWTSPMLGRVPPMHFIPVAERTGIVGQLTRILVAKALAAAARWPADVRLSLNLSAHDLGSVESVQNLVALIQAAAFDPRRLDLEITETAMMYDLDQTRWATDRLRQLGCGITLDDFGTGYSSLRQLHALALTSIKIDRSFVTGIQDNPTSYKIVRSLLALSRDMGLGCVVEGVETRDEMRVVKELGGSLVQGYLYSRPMPESETGPWILASRDGAAIAPC